MSLPRSFLRYPWPELTLWRPDGTAELRNAEAWVKFIGPFASRQLIVLAPRFDRTASRWQWLWNSSYTGILTDQPPEASWREVSEIFPESGGQLVPECLSDRELEDAWMASFSYLSQMNRLDGYRYGIPDFEGETMKVDIL